MKVYDRRDVSGITEAIRRNILRGTVGDRYDLLLMHYETLSEEYIEALPMKKHARLMQNILNTTEHANLPRWRRNDILFVRESSLSLMILWNIKYHRDVTC